MPGSLALKTLGGSGPDTLLLHGFGGDRLSWVANQTPLEAVGRLHALDLPGHGEAGTDVGDGRIAALATRVADAIDRAGLKRLRIVGHSLGGGIALQLAQSRTDLVGALALIAPAGLGDSLDADFLANFPSLETAGEAETLLRRLVQQPRLVGRPQVARVLAQLERPGARDALRRVAEGLACSHAALREAAATVAASPLPRLVIWGAGDGVNPLHAGRLAAFGGISLVVPEAGHLPHIEAPRAVNDALLRFLRELPA